MNLSHLTPEEKKRRLLDQARDCKRRRRELRKLLAEDKPLCKYGWPRLCLGLDMGQGYCNHHAKKAGVKP